METHYSSDPRYLAQMTTAELGQMFLIESLFVAGELQLQYCFADRVVLGSAVPLETPLALPPGEGLRAEYFAQRRELGVLNIGGEGTVTVDGEQYAMENVDRLYIGRGSRSVVFASADVGVPAEFYLVSYLAHAAYATTLIKKSAAKAVPLGVPSACNQRTIYRYIHAEGIRSCQLLMGFTQLAVGSVSNTMPAHTHHRRSEVYLYFDREPKAQVFHLMGTATETRHLVVADRQAVISPAWSMHSGVGTHHYSFCWAMGGENQDFGGIDPIPMDAWK